MHAKTNNTGAHAVKAIDPNELKKEFPILQREVYGKSLVYLDNAATTQKPASVIDALRAYYEESNSNVHRSLHYLSERATLAYETARSKTARFINAPGDETIVFTRGTTEAINLVAYGWGRAAVGEGDEIVLTEMEHHSNIVPWQLLAKSTGAKLRYVPLQDDGTLDLDAFHALLNDHTRLVAVTHASNVLGTINPIKDMIAAAHAVGAVVLVDAAQSVPHMPVDVMDLDCDFLAFSGHKMLAPTGIGALYARQSLLESMEPFQGGGEMILKVELHESTWNEPPHKFEAGTPNIAGAVGLAAAIDVLDELGMKNVRQHEKDIAAYALEKLDALEVVTIYGRAAERGGAVSFDVAGIHPHDLTQFVDREGVAIRAGHMCAQPLMRRFGVGALSRASFYVYNDRNDVDQLVDALEAAKKFFKV